ncbi:MAG: autoinducer binding domain-containing protein [Rhizobacter sp.]
MAVRGSERITFYSEQDLVRVAVAGEGNGVRQQTTPDIVRRLVAQTSPEGREVLVRGLMADVGFDWFGYGTVALRQRGGEPRSFFTTYAHAPWVRRYFGERYHEVDPRHTDAPRSGLPLVWSLDDIAARERDPRDAARSGRFVADLEHSGIRSGMFFQLPSPAAPAERVVLSLMSRTGGRAWMNDAVLGQALTFGLCMHEFLSCHVAPAGGPDLLSAVQRNILNCLSRGHSDKEIANRLQLSTHALDYHMRQLRRRFDVHNRVQLVNAAT